MHLLVLLADSASATSAVDTATCLCCCEPVMCTVNAGDMWEEGEMMRLLKSNLAQRTEDGRVPYLNMLRLGQVRPELVVIDPSDS